MDNWLFISILILLPVIWLWLHYSKADSSRKNTELRSPHIKKQTYHGVTIHQCAAACGNVLSLNGKRFLASEAPSLPVFGCTAKECTCIYEHHKDRRSDIQRRIPSLAMKGTFIENEHRDNPDRRKQSFA